MSVGEIFQVGIGVLRTIVSETKAILAQTGDAATNRTEADGVAWWQHIGFLSRPSKAEAGKRSAEAIALRFHGHDVIIASRDLRGLELAGELKDGETCVYAPGADGKGQARTLYKADGSIHHYTRVGNSESGAGMTVQLDAQGNAIRVLNGDGFGLIIGPEGVVLTAGESTLTLNADGSWSCIGTGDAQMDGTSILLGATGVPGLNSAIMGPAGLAGVPNPKIILGI